MEVIVLKDYEEMSKKAAEIVEETVQANEHAVLGLATGSTPVGLYENLIEGNQANRVSYKNVKTINLDEYLGLSKDHPQSYHVFMYEQFFKHIDIQLENTFIPNGTAEVPEEECARFEKLIDEKGPVNLQILGIGTNGHIAFNEPGTDPNSVTQVVELNASTREDNARFFENSEDVPTHAISLGLKTILKGEKIVLLASGKSKAEAVQRLLSKEVSIDFPASFLWNHSNVTLLIDEDAYSAVRAANAR